MHRKIVITICCAVIGTIGAAFFFCFGGGNETGRNCREDGYGAVISERTDSPWILRVEKLYGLGEAGRPACTEKELYTEFEKGGCMVTFIIEGGVSRQLIDGYAQSVWRACEKAAAGENQSGSGFCYQEMGDAGKRQEPFDYYLWYYRCKGQKYRVGVYSTEMELGVSGGLVLKIEPVS